MTEVGGAVASLREQQRSFTRERLVRAGAEVFERKGYLAATVEDIVGAAGAGRATFYLHFHTKADVLAELAARLFHEVEEFYADLDEVLEQGSRAAMRGWMARALGWMESRRSIMAAADATQPHPGPDTWRNAAHFVELMPRWVARWPAGRRHEVTTRIALLTVQFTAASGLRRAGLDADVRHEELVDAMTDIWFAGLQPPPPEAPSGRPPG